MNYSASEINELSEGLILEYFKSYKKTPERVDIEDFITQYLKISIVVETFAEKDNDRMGYTSNGKTSLSVIRDDVKIRVVYPAKTIVIDSFLTNSTEVGKYRFTLAHEAAHCIFDMSYGGVVESHFHSAFDAERSYTLDDLKQRMNSCEWQANTMAAALLMPRFLVEKAMEKHAQRKTLPVYGDNVFSPRTKMTIDKMSETLGVSYSSLLIRLRSLKMFERHDISEYVTRVLKIKSDVE